MSGADGSQVHRLDITGLHASAGGREILRGIDLHLCSGEVHVVMGPNGSGKSTLAHALSGRPGTEVTAGTVELDGSDLLALAPWERARAGLFHAFQQPVEVPGVRLGPMLAAAGAGPGPAVATQVSAEAARIGFEPRLLTRSLNVDLSGGERKRSEMIQLGVLRPPFCVLDEIDSGLDVDALASVARRIEAATEEWGLGVLAVTHFRRLLGELKADVVHVLVDGRIERSGGPELAEELEGTGYAAYGRT